MKRQLACVLAACIGLQLPLGAFNAYGAQLPESAGPMEALAKSPVWNQTAGTRKRRLRKQRKKRFPLQVHLKAIGRKMKRMEEQRQNQFPLQVPVSR